ncbi:uncharacterized protein EURHEDRAFT_407134 [Aspergillus ruber CBS 135680]|uniref:Ankyrin repeat-containing domain protein n=1 Tax=Aspergillus ruber (strain CBS 135680) TaxID=1388766 RepID=A0A017RZG4_ASPRC|nr:uncharacterized protein EURHEDRAFT_407134 [Aspergillus ruber CBS 135680]EYE90173.1 hypothetical protein EURHEDRAFT_407134 [Aspergillus ruber CBS 135680]
MKNIALDHNAAMGHPSCVNVMLAMGADVSLPVSSQHLNYTLLQRVALVVLKDKENVLQASMEVIEQLLEKGARVSDNNNDRGYTALECVTGSCHKNVVSFPRPKQEEVHV